MPVIESVGDVCIYTVEVFDKVTAADFNETSPVQVTVRQSAPMSTCLTAATDQAGLIGLLRHLHQQAIVISAVTRTRRKS